MPVPILRLFWITAVLDSADVALVYSTASLIFALEVVYS